MKAASGRCRAIADRGVRRALQRAELLSVAGVVLVGAALALRFSDQLAAFTVPILSLGLALHGVAVFGKRRIERRANVPREPWADALYWTCWLALGGLALLAFAGL